MKSSLLISLFDRDVFLVFRSASDTVGPAAAPAGAPPADGPPATNAHRHSRHRRRHSAGANNVCNPQGLGSASGGVYIGGNVCIQGGLHPEGG